jgi:hypothetical protein
MPRDAASNRLEGEPVRPVPLRHCSTNGSAMSKKTIATAQAPTAIGTYSQAVISGGFDVSRLPRDAVIEVDAILLAA